MQVTVSTVTTITLNLEPHERFDVHIHPDRLRVDTVSVQASPPDDEDQCLLEGDRMFAAGTIGRLRLAYIGVSTLPIGVRVALKRERDRVTASAAVPS
jgi:hypothetical protein